MADSATASISAASRSCPGSTCLPAIPASDAIAAAALGAVGTRFRLHGRCPAHGLDCVGLVAHALAQAGHATAPPTGYRLRGGTRAGWEARLRDARLAPRRLHGPGDILLCLAGPHQFHLAIAVAGGTVHADAGIGRVVILPGAAPWPVLSRWGIEGGR